LLLLPLRVLPLPLRLLLLSRMRPLAQHLAAANGRGPHCPLACPCCCCCCCCCQTQMGPHPCPLGRHSPPYPLPHRCCPRCWC